MDTLLNSIVAHGDTISMVVVILILAWDKIKSGTSTLNKEIITTYKERLSQLEVKIKQIEDKFNESQVANGALQATLIEKDKHIASLTALNQGKNPELKQILEEIKEFMKAIHEQNLHQTIMLEKGEVRNIAIDEASKKHEGEPTLVPKVK